MNTEPFGWVVLGLLTLSTVGIFRAVAVLTKIHGAIDALHSEVYDLRTRALPASNEYLEAGLDKVWNELTNLTRHIDEADYISEHTPPWPWQKAKTD